jgi:CubicO group peptidase (beta-lactamase class C family)
VDRSRDLRPIDSPSASGSAPADRLEAVLDPRIRKQVPGLSVTLVDAAGLRWSAGIGLADLRTRTPATAETIYHWFSMTKIATATAVMQLVDRGMVDLDAAASRYVPEFTPAPHRVGDPPVMVRQLLNHSAGLPNPLPITWVHPADASSPDGRAFTRHLLTRHARLKATPGARSDYSNLGYLVLGEVIANVSGMDYEEFVRTQLLHPLEMRHTDFVYRTDMLAESATGYHRRWPPVTPLLRLMLPKGIIGAPEGRFVALHPFYVNGPAYGGLIGPVGDAAQLLRLHLGGGTIDGQRLMSREAVAQMQQLSARGRERDVGLGWFRSRTDTQRGEQFWEHLGGGLGFWTLMRLYPDEELGIVVMGNATRYDHNCVAAAIRSVQVVVGALS